jgi:hypothetical protein
MTDDFDLEPIDYIDWDEGRDFPAAAQAEDENQETTYQEEEPAVTHYLSSHSEEQGEDMRGDARKMASAPQVGDRIEVQGGTRAFTGLVTAANEALLIVSEGRRVTYLRRSIASTDPTTWRCAGRSVSIRIITRAITRASESFGAKLRELERKTRRFGC